MKVIYDDNKAIELAVSYRDAEDFRIEIGNCIWSADLAAVIAAIGLKLGVLDELRGSEIAEFIVDRADYGYITTTIICDGNGHSVMIETIGDVVISPAVVASKRQLVALYAYAIKYSGYNPHKLIVSEEAMV